MSTKDAKDEDDMTPEEREAWLKSHGISIETPEERKAAASDGVAPIILQLQGDDVSKEIDGWSWRLCPPTHPSPSDRSNCRPDSSSRAPVMRL